MKNGYKNREECVLCYEKKAKVVRFRNYFVCRECVGKIKNRYKTNKNKQIT